MSPFWVGMRRRVLSDGRIAFIDLSNCMKYVIGASLAVTARPMLEWAALVAEVTLIQHPGHSTVKPPTTSRATRRNKGVPGE